MRQCKNCDKPIGNLERAFAWEGAIICGPCHAKMSAPHVVNPDQVFDSLEDLAKPTRRESQPAPKIKIAPPIESGGTDWLRVILIFSVVAAVIVIAYTVEYWREGVSGLIVINHGSVSASLRGSPNVTPEIDPGFVVTHRVDNQPPLSYRAWEISNQQSSPLVINKVVLNGEYSCDVAWENPIRGGQYGRDTNQCLPVTLTIGESELFFESNWNDKLSYPKDIIFVDIYTNRGNFRHKEPWGIKELTSDEESASLQAQQLYQANEAGKQETTAEQIQQANQQDSDSMQAWIAKHQGDQGR